MVTAIIDASFINRQLDLVYNWLIVNKLSLNLNKTKCMFFHNPQRNFCPPIIKINGTIIEEVDIFIFLGITIDKYLNWRHHISSTCTQISRVICVMYRLKKLSENIK